MINNTFNYKKKSSSIDIIDQFTVILFSLVVIFEFNRYFDVINTYSLLYVQLFFIIRLGILSACGIKIIYYFNTNRIYSISSTILLMFSFIFHYCKFDGNLKMFFAQFSFFFTLCMLLVASYNIDYGKLLKTYIISICLFLTIRVICSFINILPNDRTLPNGSGHYWNFGFGSHNAIFKYLVFVYAGWIYLTRSSKYRLIHIGLILSSALFIYKYTHCQTGILVIIMGILLLITYDFLNRFDSHEFAKIILKIIKLGMALTPSFLVFGSLAGTCLYNKYILTHGSLDSDGKLYTFTQRFRQFSMDCILHGIILPWRTNESSQFVHQNFNWLLGDVSLSDYNDNLVHSTLINYGIIWLLLFYLFFQAFAIYAYRSNEHHALIAISIIMIYSFMESPAYHIAWNPFLLLPFASNKFAHSNNTNIQSQVIKNSRRKNILTPTVIIPIILSIVAFIANYILFRLNYADVGAYIYISYSLIIIYTVTTNILIDR